MSQARQAKGTLLQVETSEGSGVYQTVPECRDLSGPVLQSGEYDATTHDTVGFFKEFKAGLIDPGEVTFQINYLEDNALHMRLASDQATFTERNYKKVYKTGKFYAFRGYVKNFGPKEPTDGLQTSDVAIRLTGAPTFPV
jgi:hypothetical protein